jgi:hypothetical protein
MKTIVRPYSDEEIDLFWKSSLNLRTVMSMYKDDQRFIHSGYYQEYDNESIEVDEFH